MTKDRDETLAELKECIKKNFALCYWNEDSLTEDGSVPKEHIIEPMKFVERVANACMQNPGSSTAALRKVQELVGTALGQDPEDARAAVEEIERVVDRALSLKTQEKRYIWMVTIEGSSQGDYENNASSCLFDSYADAKRFVNDDIRECILRDKIVNPNAYSESEMREAIRENVEWFGGRQAQYRDCGSVTDWKIEKVAVPPEKERSGR